MTSTTDGIIDPELLMKLLDDDDDEEEDFDDVELQKEEQKQYGNIHYIHVSAPKKKKHDEQQQQQQGGRSGRRRCGGWCKCLGWTVVVLTTVCLFVVGAGSYWLYGVVDTVVTDFTIESSTGTNPKQFPIIDLSDTDRTAILDRVKVFTEDLTSSDSTGTVDNNNNDNTNDNTNTTDKDSNDVSSLILTQDEINGLIGHSEYLRGNMMVSLHENIIEEEYSLPMDIVGYKHRYFAAKDYVKLGGNGSDTDTDTGTIEMQFTTAATHEDWFNGPLFFAQLRYLITKTKDTATENMVGTTVLSLFLKNGSLFGHTASQDFIDENQNLLESLYDHDDEDDINLNYIRTAISKIESVKIEEGRIVVRAKKNQKKIHS